MAQGIDTWAGQMVADFRDIGGYPNIKLIAAVPFEGQETVWPPSAQKVWRELLDKADEVHVLESKYTDFALHARNMWMVDRADLMLSVWEGTSGGTKNCLDYAIAKDVPYINIDPNLFKH